MKVAPLGAAQPGEFTFEPPKADYLVRLSVCDPGKPPPPAVEGGGT